MEHESHHHHHPHGTGFRWLDITLGVAATIVSLVSLWLGIHSAHSMEKLVAANSYPYLEASRSMSADKPIPGTDRWRNKVMYSFENNGVGPARIEWVQLSYKGKPMADLSELLRACCGGGDAASHGMDRRGGVTGALVRPGAMLSMFSWDEPATQNPVFNALHDHMNDIKIDHCYCSVFDECYLSRNDADKPEPVEACKAPKVSFRPRFRSD